MTEEKKVLYEEITTHARLLEDTRGLSMSAECSSCSPSFLQQQWKHGKKYNKTIDLHRTETELARNGITCSCSSIITGEKRWEVKLKKHKDNSRDCHRRRRIRFFDAFRLPLRLNWSFQMDVHFFIRRLKRSPTLVTGVISELIMRTAACTRNSTIPFGGRRHMLIGIIFR